MLKLHRTCFGCTYGVTGDGERPVYVIMIHLSFRRCNGSAVSGELDDPAGRLRVPSILSAFPGYLTILFATTYRACFVFPFPVSSVSCYSAFYTLSYVLYSFQPFFAPAALFCVIFSPPLFSFFRPSCCLFSPISSICFVEAVWWNFSTGIYPVFLAWPAGSAFRMQLGSICF